MKRLFLTGLAALLLATGEAHSTDKDSNISSNDALTRAFPQGAVLQCGDIRISKLPNGKLQATGAPYGEYPIEMKGNQIFVDGKPCVWKCDQAVTC